MRRRNPRFAYSMVELLAVLTIVAILAVILVPRVMGNSSEADKNACYANKHDVEIQAQLWYRNKGSWPANDLSDMLPSSTPPEYDYFPEGLPTCPVDGSPYTLDATTHEVVGHSH